MSKKRKTKKPLGVVVAQATQGAEWLGQLSEKTFRDEILKELFTRMKRRGNIAGFRFVHGRNEHGIDWIVQDPSALSVRYVGIQAKSQKITLQGDYKSDSALNVKQQCESAYNHTFEYGGATIRLDNVELWTSAHITEDAEKEFAAPLSREKVTVKKAEAIFALIEIYCPNIIKRIPVLAVSGYLLREANPASLPIKVLGVQLNPKQHFIEPRFSKNSEMSPNRFFQPSHGRAKEETAVYLDEVMRTRKHYVIIGPEISGKSYVLRRISCLYANRGVIPVYIDGENLSSTNVTNAPKLISKKISWLTLHEIQNPELLPNRIALLVDDADKMTKDQLISVADSCHKRIQLVCTSQTALTDEHFRNYYIAGVDFSSIEHFIRSLDTDEKDTKVLTDRVTSFVSRTLATSGLPMNPFTISAILSECRISQRRLSTPTMGRLMERFIEDQIGSHTDSARTDFETKRQFLTDIGGHNLTEFKAKKFEKLMATYLARHGHPHKKEDFRADLLDSGVIYYDEHNSLYLWTHNIFREFFWIRNLVREKILDPIAKKLTSRLATSTAAIAGSQMGNSHRLLNRVLSELGQQNWLNGKLIDKNICKDLSPYLILPSDSDEEKLLASIERKAIDRVKGSKKLPARRGKSEIPIEGNAAKAANTFVSNLVSERHYIVTNLSALLVSA